MAEVTLLNNKLEATGKVKSAVTLNVEDIHVPVVHQVVNALLASRRQGNASTKTKAEVSGGGKKPFKQKGTGNARQGSTRSPLMPGGGTVFGPKPRCYEQKVNKKVMLKAIHSILADKFQSGKLHVVDSIPATGKTKDLYKLLSGKNLTNALIVTESVDSLALRAARNLERSKGVPVDSFSVYEAIKFENLVIEKAAFEKLTKKLV